MLASGNGITTADGRAYSGGNGVRYDGFVAGESSAVLSGSLVYGGTSQGATSAGRYGIAVDAGNRASCEQAD